MVAQNIINFSFFKSKEYGRKSSEEFKRIKEEHTCWDVKIEQILSMFNITTTGLRFYNGSHVLMEQYRVSSCELSMPHPVAT